MKRKTPRSHGGLRKLASTGDLVHGPLAVSGTPTPDLFKRDYIIKSQNLQDQKKKDKKHTVLSNDFGEITRVEMIRMNSNSIYGISDHVRFTRGLGQTQSSVFLSFPVLLPSPS